MRQLLSTALVAVIVGALAGVTAGTFAQAEPGSAVEPAARTRHADRVDGKHAVAYTNKRGVRAGKLVATNARGLLPSNIVQPYWGYIKNKPGILADHQIGWGEVVGKPGVLADGQVGWNEIVGKPPGFADDVDNGGVTKLKVKRVNSNAKVLVNGAWAEHSASCPAGMVVVGGGGVTSDFTTGKVRLTHSYSYGSSWWVGFENLSGSNVAFYAIAHCLSVEPADRLEPSGKRKAPVPAGKRG